MAGEPPRVLLLIPTKTYRAQDFLDAANHMGVRLVVGSEERSSLEHLQPGGLLTLDFSDTTSAAAAVQAFARVHPIDAVVAVDDGGALVAAEAATRLGLPHNPPEALRAAGDKLLMRERLAAAGVAQPAFFAARVDDDPAALAARCPLPCVVKPLHLAASRGVLRVDGPQELSAAWGRLRALLGREDVAEAGPADRLLIEAFVPGPEVALEGLLEDGRLRVLAVFDKPDPLDGPTFPETLYVTPSRRPPDELARIEALAGEGARALGLIDGPVHVELRGEGEDLVFLEVAARTIGGLCSRALRFGVGVSLEELVLRRALRLPIASYDPSSPAAGVLMIHPHRKGTYRETRGVEAIRALPGVEEVAISAHAGQAVEPLPEGSVYLGFVFARGETPAAVEATLRRAQELAQVVVD